MPPGRRPAGGRPGSCPATSTLATPPPRVGRANHRAAVRTGRQPAVERELVVVHRAAEPELAGVPGRALDEVVVAALPVLAVVVGEEARWSRSDEESFVQPALSPFPSRSVAGLVWALLIAPDLGDTEVVGGVPDVDARVVLLVEEVELGPVAEGVTRVAWVREVGLVDRVEDLPPGLAARCWSATPRSRTPRRRAGGLFGSIISLLTPPWNQSTPVEGGVGLAGVCAGGPS